MAEQRERYSNAFTATLSGITDLFRKQKNTVELKDEDRLDGKTVLITGASSGLGFEAAVQLAKRGAKVWMACRSGIPQKGEEVKQLSGSNDVEMVQVDLADMNSIGKLVNTLLENSVKLDVLICNAAVVPLQGRKTKQGLEEMFMVNYLSSHLLVRLLLQNGIVNRAAADIPRIVFVASESHRNASAFNWDEFGKYKEFGAGKTVELYGYYKLMLLTFASELSRRLNPAGETKCAVLALCPGPVNSNIAREAPLFFKPLLKAVFALFFRSPAVAVKPLLYLACSPEEKGKSMDYLFLMSRKEVDAKATDVANGKKLWLLSEDLLASHGFPLKEI